jgi:hypothetical protein
LVVGYLAITVTNQDICTNIAASASASSLCFDLRDKHAEEDEGQYKEKLEHVWEACRVVSLSDR